MKVSELLEVIDPTGVGDDKIQIAHPNSWAEYDTFTMDSEFLVMVADYQINSLSAIREDVFRISLDWEGKSHDRK